ncbi:MAG: ATP-binding protein [bacterium]
MLSFNLIERIIYYAILFLNIALGLWVFLSNRKEKSNQVFFLMVIFTVLWITFAYLSQTTTSIDNHSLLLVKLAYGAGSIFLATYYLFVKCFFLTGKKSKILDSAVLGIFFFFAVISILTNLIIKNTELKNWGNDIIFGPGIYFFNGAVIIFLISVLILVIKGYFKFSKEEKLKTQYFLTGFLIFSIFNLIFNIIIPLIRKSIQYYQFGNYSAVFLVGFTAFAIVKRNLFGMRVVLTGILVGAIAILLLLDAFVFTPDLLIKLFKGLILIIFLYFGYLLIKNIIGEIKRREELERLTGELETANSKLATAYKSLEKLDEAKSEFISIASHQLKTPLSAIKGYVSMILEGTYGKLPQKAVIPVENVYKSGQRLIKLVNDLLNLSRIESGKIELNAQATSIEDIALDIIRELKIEAEKKKIYLKWDSEQKPLPPAFADKDKTREVIFNIVDNAIKYTNQGGVTISAKIKEPNIKITISDTGEGMDEGELEKMFKSFSRGAAGNQFYTEGIGLGLYIAKRFIEMQKGKIWAESQGKGKGSTFFMELPLSK